VTFLRANGEHMREHSTSTDITVSYHKNTD